MLLKISPQPVEWQDKVQLIKNYEVRIFITLVKTGSEIFQLRMSLINNDWGHTHKGFSWTAKTLKEAITVGENVLNDWKNQIELTGGVVK